MEYTERIIAYIDILGFREYIKVNLENKEKINKLYETFLFLKDLNDPRGMLGSLRMINQFSDLFVISVLPDKYYLKILLEDIQNLVHILLDAKLLCRGIITKGKLLHYEHIIFGPALIEAYDSERERAIFPRIIIDKSVIDYMPTKAAFHIETDSDNEIYLDYFSKYVTFDEQRKKVTIDKKFKEIIEIGLQNQDPKIVLKYEWIKTKLNSRMENFRSRKFELLGIPEILLKSFDKSIDENKL